MIELWPVCAYQLAATGEDTRCRVGWIDRAPLGDHILVIGGAGSDRGEVRRGLASLLLLPGGGVRIFVFLGIVQVMPAHKSTRCTICVASDTAAYDQMLLAR